MGVVSFPSVASGLSTEQLANLVAVMIKEVEWLANGNMDSANIRNIAGFNVDQTVLKHSSGIVGISGANPNDANAIRFWSGNADPTIAPFRVTQGGVMTAVGGLFQSSTNYPRVEINSSTSLLGAYQAVDQFVKMNPAANGTAPGFNFQNGAGVGLLYQLATDLFMATTLGSANIQISSGKDLWLTANNILKLSGASLTIDGFAGYTGSINVITSVNFVTSTTTSKQVNVTKGIITSVV